VNDRLRQRSSIPTFIATVAQRLATGKRSVTCLLIDLEGAGEVSGAARTSAVESQPSQEAAERPSEGVNDVVGSESEPEAPTGDLDPLDPELNFRRYPSAWRLLAAQLGRRRATGKASGPIVATARPTVAEPRVPQVRFPQVRFPQVRFPQLKPFTGAEGDVDWFFRQLSDLLVPPRSMKISPKYARSTALQGPGWGMV
jgi:hypothetical protein